MKNVLAHALLGIALPLATPHAATLRVCPDCPIRLPSQAAVMVKDGDTVEIEAGIYLRDAAVWRAHHLTLRGVNGTARLLSQGVAVEGKGIWVIKGSDTIVENIEFADARVADKNGAGIRLEGANLTVRNCLFRDNENGILSGANPESVVLIEHSAFDHNGSGDGRSHNIYIGAIRKFTLLNSTVQLARIGHQVKSRASENFIQGNKIQDGPSGRSSYLIDLPSGGAALIEGNTLQQGRHAENYTMVAYGAENWLHRINELKITNNIFINDRKSGCRLIWINSAEIAANVHGNRFFGCSRIDGKANSGNNTIVGKNDG